MKVLSPWMTIILNIALCSATLLIVLDYSIANVCIAYIAGDLAVSVDEGVYVITSFAVGNSVILPMSDWLSKRLGVVHCLVASILLFVVFSFLCGCSSSIQMLVVCRFFQGLVSGPLLPLSQSLLIEVNPPEKKNKMLAFFSAVVLIGPILGPALGGWIAYDYSWPWIFYLNIPIGLTGAALIWGLLKGKARPIEKKEMDWLGFFLLLVGVASLQIILDKGEQFDWFRSSIIRTLAASCIVSFTFFIAWELKHTKPFVDLRLLKIGSFLTSVVTFLLFYGVYFGAIVLVPLWLQTQMGYTTVWAGLAVAPFGIIPFFCSAFMGKVINTYGKIKPMIVAAICFVLTSIYPLQFDTSVDFFYIALSRFFFGFGVTLFVTPALSLSLQDIPTSKLASATGLFHFVRAVVGGFGTSIFTTLWDRRSIYHHKVVGENVTAFSSETQEMLSTLGKLGLKNNDGLAALNTILDQQASMLALNDCFYLMAWVFMGLIPILLYFYFYEKRQKRSLDLLSRM